MTTTRSLPPVEPPVGGFRGGGGDGGVAGAFAFAFAGMRFNNDCDGGLTGGVVVVVVGGDLGVSNHAAASDAFGSLSLSRGYGQGDECFGGDGCKTCEAGGTDVCLDWPGPGGLDMLAML